MNLSFELLEHLNFIDYFIPQLLIDLRYYLVEPKHCNRSNYFTKFMPIYP